MGALAAAGFGASQPCSATAWLCELGQGLDRWEAGLLTPTGGPLESPLSAMLSGCPDHSGWHQQVLTKRPHYPGRGPFFLAPLPFQISAATTKPGPETQGSPILWPRTLSSVSWMWVNVAEGEQGRTREGFAVCPCQAFALFLSC